MPVKQTIPSRYINRADLSALLTSLFGSNFAVKVLEDSYGLIIPRELSDTEIAGITRPQ
ncbi:uncharacterized protein K444DRAFT_622415 [Hyaloscypha bicolor E]|uniref:Uncharacterized protein n=1 Tax=Hyaloscypha bicolor E TaxID=1095630 RepID=A0A2J6SGB2_9HELO|nr:uncharacterized protein K444DRAFT_622415 [Hyaloscypha bicolor E]PMD49797.1 hypothetical protein K444DRAFT_622415 [Hyaloscypha bicolor E]